MTNIHLAGEGFPKWIPTVQAMEEYSVLYDRVQAPEQPIQIISDHKEISKCEEITGCQTGLFLGPFGGQVIFPTFRPRLEGDKRYGTQFENITYARLQERNALIMAILVRDEKDTPRLCLVRHYRVTLSNLPLDEGGGWEWEIPSCGERPNMTTKEVILSEVSKEANLEAISEPERLDPDNSGFAQMPGSSSELTQVWLIEASMKEGSPLDYYEGINGRIFLTKDEASDFFKQGVQKSPDGIIAKTGLMHSFTAAYWLTIQNKW